MFRNWAESIFFLQTLSKQCTSQMWNVSWIWIIGKVMQVRLWKHVFIIRINQLIALSFLDVLHHSFATKVYFKPHVFQFHTHTHYGNLRLQYEPSWLPLCIETPQPKPLQGFTGSALRLLLELFPWYCYRGHTCS